MSGVSPLSKMSVAGLFFVEPGVKVDGKRSQDVLHRNKCYLLSDMLRVTISSFSRTAHLHIRRTIQSNSCSVKQLISFLQSYGPPTVRTWTPLITRFGGSCSSVCTRCRSTMSTNSSGDWLTFGAVCSSVIDAAISEWRKCLQACVRVKGGHFEHLLYAVSIAEWNYQ